MKHLSVSIFMTCYKKIKKVKNIPLEFGNKYLNTDINRKLYPNHKKELVFKCLAPEKLLMAAKIQIWNRIKRRHNLLTRPALS